MNTRRNFMRLAFGGALGGGWLLSPLLSATRRGGAGLEDRVSARYPGAAWHTEVPVTAPRAEGGQGNGVIDLLLRLPSGEIVVIDHKSSPIHPDQCADKAASFAGQLCAYRDTLVAQGLAVRETWIHFPLAAVMANVA